MEDKQKLTTEIWNLHRKADQLRSMHSCIKDNYSFWSKLILAYVSIGTAVCAILIFSIFSEVFQLYIGLTSASVFIVSLIPGTFAFEHKILERSIAVKKWGEWIRSANNYCKTEIDAMTYKAASEKQIELVESYKNIMNETPTIPDRMFNKLKQKHLQKIEISKALDKAPFKSICSIRKELKKNSTL